MKIQRYILIVFLLLLSPNYQILGQRQRPVSKPKQVPQSAPSPSPTPSKVNPTDGSTQIVKAEPSYLEVPFGQEYLKWTSIPQGFVGHEFKRVYTSVFRRSISKRGEFETTDAFKKRIATERAAPLFGSVFIDSEFAFSIQEVASKYDADSQTLNVEFPSRSILVTDAHQGKRFMDTFKVLSPVDQDFGTYVGQNAIGASRVVSKSIVLNFLFAPQNLDEFQNMLSRPRVAPVGKYSLSLSIDRAKDAKENLAALFVVTFAEPFADLSNQKLDPKIDFPYDILYVDSYLMGRLEEFWLYNRKTGEIYQKVSPRNLVSGSLNLDLPSGIRKVRILSKSMTEILSEAGVSEIEPKNSSEPRGLLATYRFSQYKKDKKYKAFFDSVTPFVEKYTVVTVDSDWPRTTEVKDLKFGRYFIYANDDTLTWNYPITFSTNGMRKQLSTANSTN